MRKPPERAQLCSPSRGRAERMRTGRSREEVRGPAPCTRTKVPIRGAAGPSGSSVPAGEGVGSLHRCKRTKRGRCGRTRASQQPAEDANAAAGSEHPTQEGGPSGLGVATLLAAHKHGSRPGTHQASGSSHWPGQLLKLPTAQSLRWQSRGGLCAGAPRGGHRRDPSHRTMQAVPGHPQPRATGRAGLARLGVTEKNQTERPGGGCQEAEGGSRRGIAPRGDIGETPPEQTPRHPAAGFW